MKQAAMAVGLKGQEVDTCIARGGGGPTPAPFEHLMRILMERWISGIQSMVVQVLQTRQLGG